MTLSKKLAAEALGTFWLVFAGCGSAVLAATFASTPFVGIGFVGVSLAFGLSVLTMAFAVGHISGGQYNPAVTFGLWVAGRIETRFILPYWAAQIVGAVIAAFALYLIASGAPGFSTAGGFASNGYGAYSPGHYSLTAAFLTEAIATFFFLFIILGATSARAPAGFAPIAIGLALTLIHLVTIPVTNTSVNPARSIGPALFAGGDHLGQLWLFILAPLFGAGLAGLVSKSLQPSD